MCVCVHVCELCVFVYVSCVYTRVCVFRLEDNLGR